MSPEIKLALYLIGAVASAIGAHELKERVKNRNRKLKTGLDSGRLRATIVTDQNGDTVTQVATLQRADGRYRLFIETRSVGSDDPDIERLFDTRQGLETFLEENTRFRLGDFV